MNGDDKRKERELSYTSYKHSHKQAYLEEWNQNFMKLCLEKTYNGKGAIGKRKDKEEKKGMNKEGTLKVVSEKKKSLARLGSRKSA